MQQQEVSHSAARYDREHSLNPASVEGVREAHISLFDMYVDVPGSGKGTSSIAEKTV